MTKGDEARILHLDPGKPPPRPAAPDAPASPAAESPAAPPPPPPRPESLAERLDHALDEIRRMMIADRNKGRY